MSNFHTRRLRGAGRLELVSLANEREIFKSFVQLSIVAAGWIDIHGNWIAVNTALCEMSGYSEQEWLMPHSVGPALLTIGDRAASPLDCLVEGGAGRAVRMYHKKGYSDLELYSRKVVLSNSRCDGYLIQFKDIQHYPDPTLERIRELEHQSKLEQALVLSKQHYKSLFEQHPDGVFSLDLQARFLTLNASFERITGYSASELFQTNFINRTYKEDWAVTYDQFLLAVKGQPQVFNTRVQHKNGGLIEFRVYLLPILVDHEPRGVYGIAQDITQEKRLLEKLRSSEGMYKLIEENSFDLIARCALDGKLLYMSSIVTTMLGYAQEELRDQYTQQYMHPDDLLLMEQNFQYQYQRGMEPSLHAYRFRHKDGHYVWMETIISMVRDADGAVSELLCVSRDISERKQTEELMLRSEKLLMAGQLAAGIAHEIRNPLTSIKGFLQLLASQMKDKQEFVTIMRSELNRIEEITNELLLLAKPHAHAFHKHELGGLLKQVVSIMEPQSILNNVQVVNIPAMEPLYIRCDENQLKQVFINFIKNAIEAMPNGGLLQVTVERHQEEAVIAFIDQGCGIPEDKLATIWQPFYTTKDRGTGLGLMVSYSIIENHKGRVNVSSELGTGTTFTVHLPLLTSDTRHT